MKVGKTEFGFKHFLKPTPKNVARLGWAAFITCSTAAGTFAYFGQEDVASVVAVIGIIGMFLSNFFGNGNQSQANQENVQ